MMPQVPVVLVGQLPEVVPSLLRVDDVPGELLRLYRAQQRDPAAIDDLQQRQRHGNRQLRIRQGQRRLLIEDLNRILVLGQAAAQPDQAVQVRVGDVVNELMHRPAAHSVRPGQGVGAQSGGQRSPVADGALHTGGEALQGGRDALGGGQLAQGSEGKAEIRSHASV